MYIYIGMYIYVYIWFCKVMLFVVVFFPKIFVYGTNDLVVAMPEEMRTNQSIKILPSKYSLATTVFSPFGDPCDRK